MAAAGALAAAGLVAGWAEARSTTRPAKTRIAIPISKRKGVFMRTFTSRTLIQESRYAIRRLRCIAVLKTDSKPPVAISRGGSSYAKKSRIPISSMLATFCRVKFRYAGGERISVKLIKLLSPSEIGVLG